MTVFVFFVIAAIIAMPGILLIAYAKSGAQDTLGGVFVMLAVILVLVALALWSFGL